MAAGRYRDAIDSYERALILAPSTILLGLPLAYNFIGEPEQAIAYADKAMRLSPHIPGRVGPIFYFAKAIAFGILQDYEQALVWIERAEAAAPEILLMGFVRSAMLAMAGKEDEARAAMQRYLANDNAPIRTMSQWHARQPENRCRPIIRLFLHVFLYSGRNSTMASEKPDCRSDQRGCPRRRGDRTSGSLHVSRGSNSDLDAPKREVRFAPINGHRQLGAARPISANSGSGGPRAPASVDYPKLFNKTCRTRNLMVGEPRTPKGFGLLRFASIQTH